MKNNKGVYLFVRDKRVLYVGQTSNLHNRLSSHHYGFGCEVWVLLVPQCADRLRLEKQIINMFKPEYNYSNGNIETKNIVIDDIKTLIAPIKSTNTSGRHCSVCVRGIRIDNITGVCARCQRRGAQHFVIQKLKLEVPV